jgi:hypothetical protein
MLDIMSAAQRFESIDSVVASKRNQEISILRQVPRSAETYGATDVPVAF